MEDPWSRHIQVRDGEERKYIKEKGRNQEQSEDHQGNHPVTRMGGGEKSRLKL